MWIESHETMAVEGFMMQARVQRSAPDEVHTVTVLEKPTVEGSKGYLWSVETVYGTLVAEGSSPSEEEAKSEALAAAKADGGANDPEEFEQALQSTAAEKEHPPHWDAYYHGGGEVWEGLIYEHDGENVMIRRVWTDHEYEGVEGEEFIFEVAKYLGEDQWEDHRLVRHHVDEIPNLRMATKQALQSEASVEVIDGGWAWNLVKDGDEYVYSWTCECGGASSVVGTDLDEVRAAGEALSHPEDCDFQTKHIGGKQDPGRMSSQAAWDHPCTICGSEGVQKYPVAWDDSGQVTEWGWLCREHVGAVPGVESKTAAIASEDYPVLAEVLQERVPLEHNAGRFPGDDEDDQEEVDITPLGMAELATPGEDEQGLDPLLSSVVADSVDAIHGYVTGQHDDADRAYSSYSLLTSDERLSKTQRGSKAIHIYETVVR